MALVQSQSRAELPFWPEVRNMIYRILLTTDLPITIGVSGIFSFPFERTTRPELNMLRVNKATLTEALPFFYNDNTFNMHRAMSLTEFCCSKTVSHVNRRNISYIGLPFAKAKLSNIRHLVLKDRWLLNETRIKELRRLPHLEKLTINATWSSPAYAILNPIHCDLSARNDTHENDVHVPTTASIMEWLPQDCWPIELAHFMLARPEVELEVAVGPTSAQRHIVPVARSTMLPMVVVTFRVSWDAANRRYFFHYESERAWSE